MYIQHEGTRITSTCFTTAQYDAVSIGNRSRETLFCRKHDMLLWNSIVFRQDNYEYMKSDNYRTIRELRCGSGVRIKRM